MATKKTAKPNGKTSAPRKRRTRMIALEPRMLFDGALGIDMVTKVSDATAPAADVQPDATPAATESPVPGSAPAFESAPVEAVRESQPVADVMPAYQPGTVDTATGRTVTMDPKTGDRVLERLAEPAGQNARNEIVFIDTSIKGYESLLDSVKPEARIVLLDPARDGVKQIADFLSHEQDVDAVHILSHGNQGSLTIGTATLDIASMAGTYADTLRDIGQHLSSDADLMIYGCDFGGGMTGNVASATLSALTGADVASSIDLTGNASEGGNWTLEQHTGRIDSDVAFDVSGRSDFGGVLETLDWDKQNWTATWSTATGSMSQTFNTGSGNVTITITLRDGSGNAVTGVNPWASSVDETQMNDGNLTPVTQDALQLYVKGGGFTAADQYIDVQISFSQPGGVSNVEFGVFDIDTGSFVDKVTVTAQSSDGALTPSSISRDSRVAAGSQTWSASGNVITGTTGSSNTGSTAEEGTAIIAFNQDGITQINLRYQNAGALNAQQAISLHDISFNVAPTAPQVDLNANDSGVSAGDRFASNALNNTSTGSIAWGGNWVESDSTQSASGGNVRVTGGELRLTKSSTATRAVDLSAYSSDYTTRLSFDYRTDASVDLGGDIAYAEVYDGSAWTTVGTLDFGGGASGSASFDISAYANANTQVRIRTASFTGSSEYFYVDNVEVAATPTGNTGSYSSGGTPISVATSAATINASTANMSGATISIASGDLVSGDTLAAITSGTSITASYNSASGVLTLSGSDSRANYEQVLRSVTYSSNSYDITAGGSQTTRTISVTVTDSNSATSNTARDVITVVDTVAGAGTLSLSGFTDSGSSATDFISNDNTFTLNLAGNEAGSTVVYQVSTNGGSTWTTTTAAQTSLANGAYQYRAQVTDAAGNVAVTNVVSVTVDTAAVAGTLSLTGFVDSGSSSSDFISNDNTFALNLAGNESGSTVVYQVSTNGGSTWTTTTVAQTSLANGTYQYRAQVTDAAGNVATTNVVSVTVDTSAVAGTLSLTGFTDSGSSASDFISNDNSFTLNLAGNESGSTVVYQVSTNGGSTWTTTTTAQTSLADGAYQYRAQVTDTAGNVATTNVVTVTVDTAATAGTLSLTGFTDSGSSSGDFVSNDNTFTLNLAGNESGSSVVYQVSTNGGTTWTTTTAAQTGLADGSYQYRAQVTDTAGNVSTTNAVSVTVDTAATAGTLSLAGFTDSGSSATDFISNDNTFTLNLAGNESGSTVAYQVSTNGGSTWTTTTAAQTSLANGAYQYRAQVTDIAGNVSTTNVVSVTVDTSAPTAPTISVPENAGGGINAAEASDGTTVNVAISGTGAAAGDTLTLNWGGQVITYTVTAGDVTAGTVALTVPAGTINTQGDGTFNVTARITDVAGNAGTLSTASSVTVDRSATAGTLSLTGFTDSGSSTADFVSNDSTFTLNLAGNESGSTIVYQVSTNGGSTWTTTTAGQTGIADGAYQYRAQVTDAAGNVATTNVVTVTVDTAATAGTLSLTGFTDSGSSATDFLSSDNTFTLNLAGNESGSTVVYQVSTNGGATWTTTTAAQTSLADGAYQYRAQVTDTAGNVATTNVVTVTVDTSATAGTLSLTGFTDSGSSATDFISNDNTFTLNLAGNESGSTVVYQVSTNGGSTWTTTTAAQASLANGAYQYRAQVTDAAGNVSTTNVVSVTVDTAAVAGTLSLTGFTDSGSSATDFISNDNTFTLNLAGNESGSTVVYQVSTNGGTTWTTTTTTQTGLADGSYQYRAQVTDTAGNVATTGVVTVTVDTAAVAGTLSLTGFTDSGSSATDFISNDNTFTLNLAGNESGSTVVYQVSTNGGSTWTTTAAAQSSLANGSYQYRAQVTDAAGNVATTNTVSVTVDTAAPSAPAITSVVDNVGSIQGTVSSGGVTDDTVLVLNGTAEANSTVTIYNGATVVGTATANGSGVWTFSTGTLSNATTYSFTAKATDTAGNQGAASSAYSVTVDTAATAGTLALSNFADSGSSSSDFVSNDKTFDLTLTGQESGSTVVYQVSTNGGTTWTTTTAAQTNLADGSYQFRAQVTDAAGNVATTTPVSVTVDTAATAGTLALSNFADSGSSSSDFVSNDKTFDLTLTGQESGSTVVYQVSTNGGTTWTTTTAAQTNLADGSYQFRAQVTDAAGNVATTTPVSVTVDTAATAGTLALSNFADSGSSSSDFVSNDKTFDLTLTGQESGSTVVYQVSTNGGTTWTTTTAAQTNLADGSYQFRAQVTDAAGNVATTTPVSVTVDTAATAGTLALSNFADSGSSSSDFVSNDKTFDLTLTGQESGSTVVYQVSTNGGTTWTTTTAAQTNLADGSYQFRAQVTDAAGNVATTTPVSVTVDTAATAGTLALSNFADSGSSSSDFVSNDKTFDLTLTGQESGSTVVYQVSTNGGTTWTTTTAAQTNLADGSYQFRAQVTDAAGNVATTTPVSVTVDTAATAGTLALSNFADSGSSSSDFVSNDKTFDLTLTGQESGSTVVYQVSTNGGTTWTTTTAAQTNLADGSYQFRAQVTDAAGNVATTTPVSVTVDTAATAGTLALSNFADSGSSSSDFVSNDKTFDLTLTGQESGSTVVYQVSTNGGTTWTTTTAAQTNLADGSYQFRAQVTDAAGNVATTTPVSVTVDTAATAGTLALSNFADSGSSSSDFVSNDKTFDLTLTGQESGSTVVYQVSTNGGTTWTTTTAAQTNLADGSYQFRAQVTDAAGNVATTTPVSVTVDTAATAGTLALSNFADSGSSSSDFVSTDKTFDLTLTGQESGSTVVYQVSTNGGTTWTTTTAAQTNLADGSYQFRAQVTDAAGNVATTTPVSVTVDTAATAGTLALSNFADSGSSSSDFVSTDKTFDLTLTGQESGSTVVYQVSTNGGTTWTTTTAAQTNLADGSYQFRAQVTDAAGNVATTTPVSVTVDTAATAGTLALSNFADSGSSSSDFVSTDKTFDLTLTGQESGSTVVYQVSTNGGTTWTTTTAAQTNLADGSYQFRAQVTDAAGNVATTTPVSVTVDTAATAGTLALSNFADSGSSSSDFVSTDKTFDLTLTGQESGSTVVYQVSTNGGTTWTTTTAAQTNLADGSYQFRAQVTDAAGNVATTTPVSVTVDTAATAGTLALSNFADSGSSSSDFVSNDKTFDLTLTGQESGSTVVYQVSTNGGTTWTTTTAAQTNLADGSYQFRAQVTDAAGNVATTTPVSVTVDTAATAGTLALSNFADSGSSSSDFVSNDKTFDLTLTGQESGSTVVYQVSTNGGTTWTTTTAAQTNLADGSYQFRAQVTDAAGNVATTTPVSVTVDTAATAGTLALSNFADSGSSSSDFVSNDKTFDLTLTGQESGSTVVYQVSTNGGTTWTTTTAAQTNLADGSYQFRAQVTDAAGNVATTTPVSVTVDTAATAGTLALSNFADSGSSSSDFVSNDKTFDLTLTGQESGSTVVYQVSTNGGTTWTTTTAAQTNLADGSYQFRAQVTDAAGNVATTTPVSVTVDTAATAGTLALSNFADSGSSSSDFVSTDKTFDLTLTGQESGSTVVYQVSTNGGTTWTTTTAAQTNLADGSYQFRAQVTDAAGNVATTTPVSVTVDTAATAGTLALSNFADSGSSSSDFVSTDKTFDLTLTGQESGSTVVYQVSTNGGTTWTTTTAAQTNLADGSYQFRAQVTDAAGNVATTTPVSVTVDTAATAGTLALSNFADSGSSSSDFVSNDKTFDLTLTGQESGSTVVYQVSTNGGTTWTTTTAAQTNLADGSYQFRAQVTDAAGNVATTTPVSVTVDTAATAGTLALSNFADSGSSSSDFVSNDKTFDLTLTGQESGSTVVYQVSTNGGTTWTTTTAAQTNLADGSYQFRAQVTDAAGNVATTTPVSVTVDTAATAGTLALSNFADSGSSSSDFVSNDKTFDLTLTGQESGSTVVYQVSTNGGTTWTTTTAAQTNLADGSYQFRAQVTDAAGNVATTTPVSVTVDTAATAGTLALSNFADSGSSSSDFVSNDKTFDLTLTGQESGSTVVYQVSTNGGTTWTTTTAAQTNLADGSYQFRAQVTDAAGNVATTTPVSVTVDTAATAGTLALSNFADSGSSSSDFVSNDKTFDLTLTGQESGSTVVYQVSTNGGTTWTTTTAAQTNLADGSYQFRAQVTDAAGNVATTTPVSVTVDTAATAGTLALSNFADSGSSSSDFVSNDKTFDLTLTGQESGSTVVYQVSTNGGTTWTTTTAAQTNLADGSYQFRAQVTDAAGNVATTTPVSVTVDTAATAGTLALSNFADSGSSSSDFVSNDKTFDLTLTGQESGSTVVYQVSTNGGTTWTTTTAAQTNLADGSYQFRAQVTDAAGNVATTTPVSVTVDTAATAGTLALSNFADSGSSSSDFVSNDKTFDLTLTGQESGSTVVYQVSTNGGTTWTTTTAAQTNLADGSYQFRAQVTDAAGNVATTTPVSVTVDTAATAGTLALSNFADSGSSSSDFVSNDKTFDLTLTGQESGSTVVYQVSTNGGTTWTTTTAAQTNLADGSYQFRAQVTDAAGNVATTTPVSVTVDTAATAGTLALSNFADSGSSSSDFVSNDKTFDLTLTGQESGSTVVYQVSTNGGTTWTTTTAAQTNLADGSYQFRAQVTDAAGNVATTTPVSVTVDTAATAPVAGLVTDSGSSSTDRITNVASLTVSGVESGATVEYSSNGTTWSATAPTPVQGSNTVYVRQTDKAGNTSASAAFTFTYDSAAPAPTVVLASDTGSSGTDRITSQGALNVSGTESGASVQYSADGTTWSSSAPGLVQGSNTVYVRQVDVAGNTSTTTSFTFTYDTTPPGAPTMDALSASGDQPRLGGTYDSSGTSTLSVTVDGVTYVLGRDAALSVSGNRWTLDLGSTSQHLGAGSYDVRIVATDAAGNSVSDATSGELVVASSGSGSTGASTIAPTAAGSTTGGSTATSTTSGPTTAPSAGDATPTVGSAGSTSPAGGISGGTVALADSVDRTVPSAPSVFQSALTGVRDSAPSAGADGTSGTSSGTASIADLNALPPTAAGVNVAGGFPVVRVNADGSVAAAGSGGEAGASQLSTVSSGEGHRLFVYHGVPDMQLVGDGNRAVRIPEDAFAHTDPAAVVQLEARLADGSPLPAWLKFEGLRGTFAGNPPDFVRDSLEIEVVARDSEGREARTVFKLSVEDLRAEEQERERIEAGDPSLGLDVDKKEREKAQQGTAPKLGLDVDKKEAERQAREQAAVKGKPGDAKEKAVSNRFGEQLKAARTARDPLLALIVAGGDNPNRPVR